MFVVRRLASGALVLITVATPAVLAQRPAAPPAAAGMRPIAPPPDSVPRIREPIAQQPAPPAIATLSRPLPLVLPFDRYTIVASTTWSHDSAGRTSASDAAFLRCTGTLRIPRDTARALMEAEPWREFDVAASTFPYVLFQVMPLDTPPVECGRMRSDAPRYLQRGALFTRTGVLDAESNVTHVDVLVDSSVAPPAIYGRVPAVVASPATSTSAGAKRADPHQVRVYVPMAALDPRNGRFPTTTLSVWSDSLPPIRIPVRSSLTKALWHELVPWRIDQRRDGVASGTTDVPSVPDPNDAMLRAAVDRYRTGRVTDATEQAAAWRALDLANSGGVDSAGNAELRHDRLIADVMVGGVLAAVGDTVAASAFAVDALATAPCLIPTTSASGTYARVLTRTRPEARCTSLSRSAIIRRGLLFPGGGHSVAGDRGHAVMAASVVTGAFVGAAVATWSASTRYDKYEQANSVERAASLYDDAAMMRSVATGLVIGGVALWIGDIGYAILREKRHAERVRAEQSFGRTR